MGNGNLYRSSDGRYFGDAEIWERFESGSWTPCCWDTDTGEEWVETPQGELLALEPISPQSLPDWADVERDVDGVRITGGPSVAAD